MILQTSNVTFYNENKEIGKYDINSFEDIKGVLDDNSDDLKEWDYFEFYMTSTTEESKDDGRYYKHEQIVNITETFEGYEEFLSDLDEVEIALTDALGEDPIADVDNFSDNGQSDDEADTSDLDADEDNEKQ